MEEVKRENGTRSKEKGTRNRGTKGGGHEAP